MPLKESEGTDGNKFKPDLREGPNPIGTGHPTTSSAPLYRLNHSKSLIGGTGEPRELVVDSFIREGKKGPKHGGCRTLEWQRKA
ncbi:hypothetical protein V6N12_023988 [Hibiscus sabdariffa]|uniref:Uncharacterized protein n=1 Tax=Hibiscus sabdariffa TaxID=183260 RepID=A0ABR2FZ96_9ROSI